MTHSQHAGAISLAGQWTATDECGAHRFALTLPGDIITGLHAAGQIPDPYWGRNEYDLRWICERDWILTREIELDRTDFTLVLGEVDTVATISLNNIPVLETQNAHRTYRADISRAARVGANTLEIRLHSVTRECDARAAAQPFPIPDHGENSPIRNGNMLRKPQCDFGWDWNIALAASGVYGALRLEPHEALRIERLAISQDHSGDGVAVRVAAHLDGVSAEDTALTFTFGGMQKSIAVPKDSKAPGLIAEFQVANPELWWPAGQGMQPLYDLSVQLGAQTEERRIGLRQIELVSEPDEIGRSFLLKVNGRPIFCKGANWIPADALAGRIDPQEVEELLQSAVQANMNMIRIWGGGRYEPTWLHDLCDEMGLLVWQDFMFACNLYPSTPDFLAEVEAEVRDTVARLHHHASTALWCGDNELVGALTWFEESRRDRDRYLVNYDRLNRALEATLLATDPQAIWWPSSPTPGPLSFGDAWHDDSSGDMHFWSVWHEGRDFDHYRDVSPRFCSEFGFQSYPSMDVIRRFAAPEDFNISAPVFESHQKNKGGNARIAETMFRYFRFPNGFENFVYLSQVQQALAIHTAVTHWRSLKPHCMGTLIWQLNDTWPVCSWSSLDHGGGWKLLHHAARRFYAPVFVSAVPDGSEIVLHAINDAPDPVEITLEVAALSMDGSQRLLGSVTASLEAGGANEIFRVTEIGALEVLVYRWHLPDGTTGADHFAPRPYKAYPLEAPEIDMEVVEAEGAFRIQLTAAKPAFFTALEADVPGQFSENGVLLLPGVPAEIQFTPKDPAAKPNLTLRDLHSASSIYG
ncbi:glycoside hydrolase family 2 protein [Tropicimonas sp. TH_r6]|uniref:beta-mannosidase n=1 Tax=Tropicimonas sp. TH_r6 TaxID=3082085 RepID=UPI002955409F|nr:glycoside hydrolase family 2 protein [Tropicimonas sp. TH_r6]MDV7142164.1 glycoside hydrolase family 2 protein [Tropicimonas sp. TH_r6]